MKFKFIFPLFVLLAALLVSCNESTDGLGVDIQPTADKIFLKADTFHLSSQTVPVDSIVSKPDSLLLGTFIDDVLGTTRGDILTQLAIPTTNYTYLDPSVATTTPDSIVVSMSFNSYFGVSTSPMEISIYELKKALSDKENYFSNLDPAQYVDFSKRLNASSELLTIKNGLTGVQNTRLSIKLSDEFIQRFFTTNPTIFKSQADFLNFFKGLYITTNFGSSAMININNLSMTLYYHYILKNDPTQAKIKGYHTFTSNSEVVKVNLIRHPFRTLATNPNDEFNYIASPANYQTRVRIPLSRLRQRINVGDMVLDINSAVLKVNVQDRNNWGTSELIPYVSGMLLIKETALNDFFTKHELPSDTVSFIATLGKENITATTYKYNYTFSGLNKLIKNEILNSNKEYLDMVLVPVSLLYSTSSSSTVLSGVYQSTQMQAVSVYSGNNKDIPMKLEVIFSGL
ncbi:MAG: DUF4270 domain-containing protein [Paludibacteraceae bacterium]